MVHEYMYAAYFPAFRACTAWPSVSSFRFIKNGEAPLLYNIISSNFGTSRVLLKTN